MTVTWRRLNPTGATYTLATRIFACDPMNQRLTYETRIERWRDGEREARERRRLDVMLYVPGELRVMLEAAGFVNIEMHGEHERREPAPGDDFVVLVAHR